MEGEERREGNWKEVNHFPLFGCEGKYGMKECTMQNSMWDPHISLPPVTGRKGGGEKWACCPIPIMSSPSSLLPLQRWSGGQAKAKIDED